jgi:hypothetical protein
MTTSHKTENYTTAGRPPALGLAHGSPSFLSEIGERLRTQDNRITENPMFCVQTHRRDVVPDGFSDETVWVLDGEEVDADTDGAEEYGIRWRWETVMVAFTEEGCKEYLRQNGHNLSEPRIYVESFNRCPEMIAIREWLMANIPSHQRAD